MRTIILGVAAAGLLAACSDDTAREAKKEAKAEALQPGEYEVAQKVDAVRSADNTTPATALKATPEGEAGSTSRVCIGADGAIDPKMFAEGRDQCSPTSSYMRGGRLSIQLNCTRAGKGALTQTVDGKFTADSFEATATSSTYFSGPGDYALQRTLTGRRVGDCAASKAPAGQ